MQWQLICTGFLLLAVLAAFADAMTPRRVAELRQETIDMFYHGFDNYMDIAFPEDEVCFSKVLYSRNNIYDS
jgi:hypothetical protein